MANTKREARDGGATLPGFRPFSELWSGPAPLFPSEQSARWFKRQHARSLASAEALAIDRGAYWFHPERFAAVRERVAIDAAKARAAA